ncbi:MAG: methyltransferase domain-containing protein [Acidobacteriota bacterium]
MAMSKETATLDVERVVNERYSKGAREREASLCCPVEYDPRYLDAIPADVLERDYGCGDPSRYVREGDTVLDLGSGAGKVCFIASQVVGPAGHVIGVDMNQEMLAVARRAAMVVSEKIGYQNVTFRRGRIQDLRLDPDLLDAWLAEHPVRSAGDLSALEDATERLRNEHPMVPDESVDIIISNCVLNLVRQSDRRRLIRGIFRALKVGGRIAISDIVSDEIVPEALKANPELWSGCISGAFHERELIEELEAAGFHGIEFASWAEEPFRVVDGIEFRSVTVTAHKGKQGPCYEENQAVMYRGPWKQVEDDDHHVLRRGERTAVCAKTYKLLQSEPYAAQVIAVPPRVRVPESDRKPFDCSRTTPRHPRETKGADYSETRDGDTQTRSSGGCC